MTGAGIRTRTAPSGRAAPRSGGLLSVAVVSGKGGVGKTSLVANLAVALADMGRRVLVLDGNLGLANVDLVLGIVPRHTLYDVVMGRRRLEEIVVPGPGGILLLPASSGIEKMADLDDARRETLLAALERVSRDQDFLLIDTGPGIHRQEMRLAQAADEILVVTTPEPPAFANAYATLKVLASRRLSREPRLVVTMARDESEAGAIAHRLQRVARRFLGFAPEFYATIPADEAVPRSIQDQQPFVRRYPDCRAAAAVRDLAARLAAVAAPAAPDA